MFLKIKMMKMTALLLLLFISSTHPSLKIAEFLNIRARYRDFTFKRPNLEHIGPVDK